MRSPAKLSTRTDVSSRINTGALARRGGVQPDLLQLSLDLLLRARGRPLCNLVEYPQHPLLFGLTQPANPLVTVVNGFANNFAFWFVEPRRGVFQAPDGRLVEREGHLGRCRPFDPVN